MARWILSRQRGKCSGGSGMPFNLGSQLLTCTRDFPSFPARKCGLLQRECLRVPPWAPSWFYPPLFNESHACRASRICHPQWRAAFRRIRGSVCVCANTGACVVLFGYRDFVQAFSPSKYLSTTCVWTTTWNRADWNREVKSLASCSQFG